MSSKHKKRKLRVVTTSLLSALVACHLQLAQAASDQSWSSAYEQGMQALSAETPGRAEQQFRKAVGLVKKQSNKSEDIDKCQLKLAESLKLLDRAGEARTILQSVLSRISKKSGADSASVEPILMELGSIEESAGNHSVAMNYYNRALNLTEKHYGPYSPMAAKALHGLGRVNGKTGRRDAASANYKRAISILSQSPNLEAADQLNVVMHEYKDLIRKDDTSDTDLIKDFQSDIMNDGMRPAKDGGSSYLRSGDSVTSSNRSASGGWKTAKSQPTSPGDRQDPQSLSGPVSSDWQHAQQTNSAKSQFQQQSDSQLTASRAGETSENTAVALRGIHLPASDDTLNPAFKVVSDTVFSQSRYRLSESQYQRMIATDINSLGPNHPSVANDLNGLAQLYVAQEKYREAKPLLTRALSIYRSTYGSSNVLTINTMSALASVEFQLNNIDDAVKLYRTALTAAQSTLGPNSIETAGILNGLAYLYFQQGQLDSSCTIYEWAVASTERAVGANNPLLAACLKDYAQVLRRLDKSSKASEVEARAGQILSQSKAL
ncbi:MAG: tetratricopeptide repeat protein [Candidatus Obscuribacterales bacterium]|nr:tetratricopeptide repeat protein [Candidatus Obscuribacterales bacterium]